MRDQAKWEKVYQQSSDLEDPVILTKVDGNDEKGPSFALAGALWDCESDCEPMTTSES